MSDHTLFETCEMACLTFFFLFGLTQVYRLKYIHMFTSSLANHFNLVDID